MKRDVALTWRDSQTGGGIDITIVEWSTRGSGALGGDLPSPRAKLVWNYEEEESNNSTTNDICCVVDNVFFFHSVICLVFTIFDRGHL